MATIPHVATGNVPVVTSPSASNARTIGALAIPDAGFLLKIKEFLIPVEFQDQVTQQKFNFRVNLGQLALAISRIDLGLDQVNNTSDEDKPISNAVRDELNKFYSQSTGIDIGSINGLSTILGNYREKTVDVPLEEVEGLVNLLAQKANAIHSHNQSDFPWLSELLGTMSLNTHNHTLSSLDGWTSFVQDITTALAGRTTPTQVLQIVNENAIIVGIDEWN